MIEHVLDWLVRVWPSPVARRNGRIGAEPGTIEFDRGYTVEQFMARVWSGVPLGTSMPPLWGKRVLEIGCGHGGITCWLAALGAREVVGIDLNTEHVKFGRELAAEVAKQSGRQQAWPVRFLKMDAKSLAFGVESFDVVYADNCFEHFDDPRTVMLEARRVLRKGGLLLVPSFSSILSKYGLHLKIGLKLPWLNLVLDEPAIVAALERQAKRRPELYGIYPGLSKHPTRVRDVRRHQDLNDITHEKFLQLSRDCGFEVRNFRTHATLAGRVLRKIAPASERTVLFDVLSTGAAAVLIKPE